MHPIVALVAGLVVTEVAVAVTTVYLHRGLAHRALTVHPAAAFVCRVALWLTTGMRPREWAAVHRRHHAATDTDDDPHSPIRLGYWRVQLANAALYRRAARDRVTVRKYGRDLPADRLDRWFFDHSFLGLGIGVVLICAALGWRTGLLAAGIHAVTYLMLSGAINAMGHTVGRRPYPNSATNGKLLALVTGGEGLHNNHHAAPTSATFALGRGDLDPGWWLVRLLVSCRLATVRHSEVHLRDAA